MSHFFDVRVQTEEHIETDKEQCGIWREWDEKIRREERRNEEEVKPWRAWEDMGGNYRDDGGVRVETEGGAISKEREA